ncbi:MAG TPA: dihydrofolate reductase family protein [Solirubrobacteraceae bacterium]|nr:dihydrofolate reductase family protein [Solirubrobacteraceae bacterium]
MSDVFEQLTATVPAFARTAADDLPAIAVNMVTSVDGATALGGRVGRLTGPADQLLLRRLREESDAVLVGAATVRAEGYSRLLRDDARERRQRALGSAEPLLCVVSRDANLGPGAPALRAAPSALIFLTSEGARLPDAEREVLAIRAPTGAPGEPVQLRPLLARLRADHGVKRVTCEGGGTLNAALLAEGAVGELFVAVSPMVARELDSPPLVGGFEGPVDLTLLAHAAADDFVFLRYGLRS